MDKIIFPEEILKREPEYIDEIELNNGVVVQINTNLSIAQMKRFRTEGLISNETMNNMLNGKIDNLADDKSIMNAPYIAYKAAGGELTKEEFEELLPYEIDTFMMIYAQLITSKRAQQKNHFRQKLASVTKK